MRNLPLMTSLLRNLRRGHPGVHFGLLLGQLGQSKVQHLGIPALVDEDVCRLDVSVDDAFGVSGI